MRRTINSTGRQKIERGDITLTLSGPEEGPRSFDLSLDLSAYDLPGDARVFVEASRQTAWMRFDFATVAELLAPEDRTLSEFGSAQLVTFRVKVVEALPNNVEDGPDGQVARILAQADRVPPGNPEDAAPAQSLLAIDWNEEPMGDELWRLEVGETEVILRVNKSLLDPLPWTSLTDSDAFRAVALPAILREVLTRVLLVERDDDPLNGSLAAWIKFGQSTLGAGSLPSNTPDGIDIPARESWINRAVELFAKNRGIRSLAARAELIPGGLS